MNYVYVLHSKKNNELYVGCTQDLKKRLTQQNSGKIPATKSRTPLGIIHYEVFKNRFDAYFHERWLKNGWGRKYLRKTLHNEIKSLGG